MVGPGDFDAPLLGREGLDRPDAHPLLVVVVVGLFLVDEGLVAVTRVRRGRFDHVLGREGRRRRVFPGLRLRRQLVLFRQRRFFRVLRQESSYAISSTDELVPTYESVEAETYPDRLLFGELLLFGLLLQLVVRHGDDGQDQVNKIERTKEYNNYEKQHVPGPRRPQHQLVQIFPVVLGHQPER